MAGSGPAPKAQRSRGRDTAQRDVIKSDGLVGGFPLPEDALRGKDGEIEDWHPMTVQWWEAWRASPQGTRMMSEPDWYFLLDTALMHHAMWANGRWEFAAEVRLRSAKFGATPEDRLRLKQEIEVPEQFPVGNGGNVVTTTGQTRQESRRAHLKAVKDLPPVTAQTHPASGITPGF
jgi:hypothetical protein